jgi:hypothetical protein
MRKYFIIGVAALAGCAASPQQMAQRSDWDVCRFTMGGPSSSIAEQERQRRGLDCRPLYPAIAAHMQAQNAATANLIRSMTPPPPAQPAGPVSCTSYRVGNQVQTDCR